VEIVGHISTLHPHRGVKLHRCTAIKALQSSVHNPSTLQQILIRLSLSIAPAPESMPGQYRVTSEKVEKGVKRKNSITYKKVIKHSILGPFWLEILESHP
jgi:hypothetical protein